MIKYKLVDKEGYTRRGETGETFWFDGLEKIAQGYCNELCTSDVIHYYDHPLLAVLFNPIHANIPDPRLITIEIDRDVAHDGLKGGCKSAKFAEEIKLPVLTIEQRVEFAIKISLKYYKDTGYLEWAKNWLVGKYRSISAESALSAARSAESAAWSALSAARSAELAARSARSAESAAWSARSAAASAELAAWSARSAARSAAWSKINKLFIKTILSVVKIKK